MTDRPDAAGIRAYTDDAIALLAQAAEERVASLYRHGSPDPYRNNSLAFRWLLRAALNVRPCDRLAPIVAAEGALASTDVDDHREMERAYRALENALRDASEEAWKGRTHHEEIANEQEEREPRGWTREFWT